MKTIINWQLPIKIANEGNSSEHWSAKGKRHKKQQDRIHKQFLIQQLSIPPIIFPCHVHLTRIAPRELDSHDNLTYSFKWVVDAIAAQLTGDFRPGRADGCKGIKWSYSQQKGLPKQYALKIEISHD